MPQLLNSSECELFPLREQPVELVLGAGGGAAGLDPLALLLPLVTPAQFLAQLFRRSAFRCQPDRSDGPHGSP